MNALSSASGDIDAQADRIRALLADGRSDKARRLFDYLLQCSLAGVLPKEIDVAMSVFDRGADYNVSEDSIARVYVHRLRDRLNRYYAGIGRREPIRLVIPKGEYRIAVESQSTSIPRTPWLADEAWRARAAKIAAYAALIVLSGSLIAGAAWAVFGPQQSLAAARRSPAWVSVFAGDRPITLVVGDYYIFGEVDAHAEVARLVREYNINSPDDLANSQMGDPLRIAKYRDLSLTYLPTSVAPAFHSLMPFMVRGPNERDRVRVISASGLATDILKTNNIVYVGYLSALGPLHEAVLAGSRFEVGETFDELVDRKTGRRFASEEGGPTERNAVNVDLGYFSTFPGPHGGQVVIVAGARDMAVMYMAEILTNPEELKALVHQAGGGKAFEALYEVQGVNRTALRGRLLLASPLKTADIWNARTVGERVPLN